MRGRTLILAGTSQVDEKMENRVFDAGCDDALLGVRDGIVYLDFDRRGGTFEEALISAIHDVESAGLVVRRPKAPKKGRHFAAASEK